MRHFPISPSVDIRPDERGSLYALNIVAADRPGLLAISPTLARYRINLQTARINTLGDRAEDVFLVAGARLHDEVALLKLETSLHERLRLT